MDSESCFLGGSFWGGSPPAKLPLSMPTTQATWRLHLKSSWLFEETEHPFTPFHFNGLTSAEFCSNLLDSTAKKKKSKHSPSQNSRISVCVNGTFLWSFEVPRIVLNWLREILNSCLFVFEGNMQHRHAWQVALRKVFSRFCSGILTEKQKNIRASGCGHDKRKKAALVL